MSKYTILGKYVFVSNDSMIAEFSNLMLIISEHDEKYIKKERRYEMRQNVCSPTENRFCI